MSSNNSFDTRERFCLTAESVTEGHPDKLCDQISDAILDAMLAVDPYARVACEVAVTTGMVFVLGEVTCAGYVDIASVVRSVVCDAGYAQADAGFDYHSCGVLVSLDRQSPDIARGVGQVVQVDEFDTVGAGDQGMMVGYACRETSFFLPLPALLAHQLCERLAEVRTSNILPYLRPDGKSQVTVEYHHGQPGRIAAVVLAAQHAPGAEDCIARDLTQEVVDHVLPPALVDDKTEILVNGTGRFVIGGPVCDTGFTGRKAMVDAYGTACPHGGGAFSGKDPTKVDRSGAYMARYVAKNLVAAGVADRLQLQVAYVIGKARPLSVSVETYGTSHIADETIESLAQDLFDWRPAAIIDRLDLLRPIYRPTAAYGHFYWHPGKGANGRYGPYPWEVLEMAEEIAKLAGTDLHLPTGFEKQTLSREGLMATMPGYGMRPIEARPY